MFDLNAQLIPTFTISHMLKIVSSDVKDALFSLFASINMNKGHTLFLAVEG